MEYKIFLHLDQTNLEGMHDLECTHTNDIVYTIFALIDHSPVGRIHSEEWA